jgi:ATP-dependent RNA helicase DeaD
MREEYHAAMSNQLSAAGFASLGLEDRLVKAVVGLGYEEPTPIQREAIRALAGRTPSARRGRHGKTAAFALPLRTASTDERREGVRRAR